MSEQDYYAMQHARSVIVHPDRDPQRVGPFRPLRSTVEASGERHTQFAGVGESWNYIGPGGLTLAAEHDTSTLSPAQLQRMATAILEDDVYATVDVEALRRDVAAGQAAAGRLKRDRSAKVPTLTVTERKALQRTVTAGRDASDRLEPLDARMASLRPVGYRWDSKAEVVPAGIGAEVHGSIVRRANLTEAIDTETAATVRQADRDGAIRRNTGADVVAAVLSESGRYAATVRTKPFPFSRQPVAHRVRSAEQWAITGEDHDGRTVTVTYCASYRHDGSRRMGNGRTVWSERGKTLHGVHTARTVARKRKRDADTLATRATWQDLPVEAIEALDQLGDRRRVTVTVPTGTVTVTPSADGRITVTNDLPTAIKRRYQTRTLKGLAEHLHALAVTAAT